MVERPGAGQWKHCTERHNQQYILEKQDCDYEPHLIVASRKGWRRMCLCSRKGVVPGHAGDTDTRGNSRELR